jgi:RNA polymerase sigma-70 factor (ECF subfamily)
MLQHGGQLTEDELKNLLDRCRQNDPAAQEKLYLYCYPAFINICARYAGDLDGAGIIFNNAMLRIFKSLDKYQDLGRFMGWVRTIIVNCCLDHINKQHKVRFTSLSLEFEEESTINTDMLDNVSMKEIQQIIWELPKATAIVFNLFIFEGYTHKDISSQLNIAEGTSKWHISEGRKILKQRLHSLYAKK